MFNGGGVPIDHYIIQVDNGTQLETPGPAYSFDIMYNTTLSGNISAHNCAGYSDPFPLMIQYNPQYDPGAIARMPQFIVLPSTVYSTGSEDEIPSITPRPTNGGSSDGSLVLMIVVVVPASAGTLLVITISIVITLLIIYRHCKLSLLFCVCYTILVHL